MTKRIVKSREIPCTPSLSPVPASTASIPPGNKVTDTGEELFRPPQKTSMSMGQIEGNAIQAVNCHTVNITQNQYHQNAGPLFAAMLEKMASLEAKIDELSKVVTSMGKKHRKTRTPKFMQLACKMNPR